jgi:hypothetical protein
VFVFRECDNNLCKCTGHAPCPTVLSEVLVMLTGHSIFKCENGTEGQNCVLGPTNRIVSLQLNCTSGECVRHNGTRDVPRIDKVYYDQTMMIVVLSTTFLVIFGMVVYVVVYFMFSRVVNRYILKDWIKKNNFSKNLVFKNIKYSVKKDKYILNNISGKFLILFIKLIIN